MGAAERHERRWSGAVANTYQIRSDVIWPPGLSLPPRPPRLVYLDMLAFINLAKVAIGTGTAPAGYDDLLAACRRARADGHALFPLSSTHIMEIYEIGKIEQRRAVAAVMEELSGFQSILGRPQILELEVEAALNELPNVKIAAATPIPLIGPTVLHAFGQQGGLRFEGAEATESAWWADKLCRDMNIDPGDDAMATLNRWVLRQLVAGPEDHDDPELRSLGYTLGPWRKMLEQRAEQERYLVGQLDSDPQLRRGRLRDVVNAREMTIELEEPLAKATTAMGTTIGQLVDGDRAKLRDFSDGMPSTRVAASMKERYHRDSRHDWTTNDIQDIDALAIALPYLDAILTDKAARNNVDQAKELRLFGTFLAPGPKALADWLDEDGRAPGTL